jgi:hypothetical protein
MRKQRGITFGGMLFVCALLVAVALMLLKVVPLILEYRTIQTTFKSMAEDPKLRTATAAQMRNAWENRNIVGDVKSLPPENIEYVKEGNQWTISAEYSAKVPLFANVSLLLDFHPSSDK